MKTNVQRTNVLWGKALPSKNFFLEKSKQFLTKGTLRVFMLFGLMSSFQHTVYAQSGTAADPFTALGMAQNITTEGVYYFNLTGTTFSSYVKTGGWVQVAIDFGGSSGGALPQTNSLTLSSRGILSTAALLKLGTANTARIYVSNGQLDVQNTNATILSRIVNNQALHKGGNDNGINSWTGTNTTGASFSAGGCNATSNNGLHQRVVHVACNGSGVHWIPVDNMRQVKNSSGEISSSNYFQLLVQAPMVAVVSGPVINTQPASTTQSLCLNTSATALTVSATGSATLTYQWYKNLNASNSGGTLISGATSSSYTPLTNIVGTAYYYVVVTNSISTATSSVSGAITTFSTATASNAGSDQTGVSTCGLTTVPLAANTPVTGSGAWSIVSGSGGTIASNTNPSSNFTGTSGSSYTLRWTISNGACVSTDDVLITFNPNPTPSITQTGCNSPITLSATTPGNAIEFGASNNSKYVSVPSSLNAAFSTNRITLEGWFNQSTSTVGSPMLIGEAFNGDGKVTFAIYLVGQTIKAGFYNGSWVQASSVATLTLNTWTHIAVTYDQTSIKLYINGVLNASFATALAIPTGTEVWYLGKRWDGTTETFSGKMDEVRIWNVARTQAEIQASMNSTVPTNTTGLKAYFKFDESTGATASDATGNGYTGTLINSPTWQVPSTSVIGGATMASYAWSPDGQTTSSISVTSSGTYSVTTTNSIGCTSNPVSVNVTVGPTAGNLSGNQSICVSGTSTFISDGSPGGSWSSSSTAIATVNSSTGLITGVSAGTATITYTIAAAGGCSSVSATRTITVSSSPTITMQPSTSVQNVCQNGTTTALTLTATGGGLTYQWYANSINSNTGGTPIVGATLATFTPSSTVTGTTYYYCIVSGNCNPSATSTVSGAVTIFSAPTASNAGSDQTGATTCGLTTIPLAGNSPSVGTGSWSIVSGTGGSITTASNPISNFSGVAGNTYTLRWTITNGSCTSTDDVVITFNQLPSSATLTASSLNAELLVVAGGGGAGSGRGGGGGGGGYISVPSYAISSGSTAITVGAGGAKGVSGSNPGIHALSGGNSSFGSAYVAIGGGGGGSYEGPAQNGYNGGSGGAGSTQASGTGLGGNGTAGQGNKGGNSTNSCGGGEVAGGGGGGAGAAGQNAWSSGCSRPYNPGAGGNGLQNSISGTAVWYSGGGGGGGLAVSSNLSGNNGLGGGQANYGGGGQCKLVSGNFSPENGGPGIVIIKYAGTPVATGGTITQIGGYTIHTFTSSGTFTVNGSSTGAVVPNQSRCGTGTVTFTSTIGTGLTLDWYDDATGGNLLASGTNSYTTPVISSTTTYYVAVRNTSTNCVSASRLAVTATITGSSSISANQSICSGSTPANIVVTAASGSIQWQSSNDNITFNTISGQTNATLTGASIGALTATKYVRAIVTNGTCIANSPVHTITMNYPTTSATLVSGNVVWGGATSTNWNTASNWYNFDGTNYSVASAVPTNAIDVIIPANQTCVLAQPSVLSSTTNAAKNVTIESGATLTLAGGTLNVAGNWTNNGTFTGSTGTVSFNGSGAAALGGTSSTTFANLSMDKSGSVALSTPVTVSGSLALNNGIIELGANNLTLGAATVTGGSATSYVKTASTGTVSRNVTSTATTFPVGNSTYNPAVLTNNGTSDVFSVRVIDNVTANGTGVGATTSLAVVNRTWMISEATTGGSNASVRLYWNGAGEEVNGFSAASAYVAHYSTTGSMWENMGGSVGADYVQSTDAITNFSPFTISSTNTFAPLPVELLSFDAQCADQDVIVRWTTASEHNSLNFAVQRSEDGTTWNDVQTVAAAGNSNTVLDYAIQDLGAARGVKYYRLIQTDQDGVQKIYGPIQTNCGSDALSFLTFPNPSTEEFTILFGSTDIQGDVTLTVSDATGKVVRNAALFIEKGTASMLIPSLDLAPGVYQIQLTGDNFQSAIIKHSLR